MFNGFFGGAFRNVHWYRSSISLMYSFTSCYNKQKIQNFHVQEMKKIFNLDRFWVRYLQAYFNILLNLRIFMLVWIGTWKDVALTRLHVVHAIVAKEANVEWIADRRLAKHFGRPIRIVLHFGPHQQMWRIARFRKPIGIIINHTAEALFAYFNVVHFLITPSLQLFCSRQTLWSRYNHNKLIAWNQKPFSVKKCQLDLRFKVISALWRINRMSFRNSTVDLYILSWTFSRIISKSNGLMISGPFLDQWRRSKQLLNGWNCTIQIKIKSNNFNEVFFVHSKYLLRCFRTADRWRGQTFCAAGPSIPVNFRFWKFNKILYFNWKFWFGGF